MNICLVGCLKFGNMVNIKTLPYELSERTQQFKTKLHKDNEDLNTIIHMYINSKTFKVWEHVHIRTASSLVRCALSDYGNALTFH